MSNFIFYLPTKFIKSLNNFEPTVLLQKTFKNIVLWTSCTLLFYKIHKKDNANNIHYGKKLFSFIFLTE